MVYGDINFIYLLHILFLISKNKLNYVEMQRGKNIRTFEELQYLNLKIVNINNN